MRFKPTERSAFQFNLISALVMLLLRLHGNADIQPFWTPNHQSNSDISAALGNFMTAVHLISVVRDFAMYDGSRVYRIKTTLKEALDQSDPLRAYTYQINNIEVLVGTEGPVALPSANTPMDVNILLHSVFDVNGLPIVDKSTDRNALWGPVGASTRVRFGLYHQWQFVGSIEECKKDGSNPHTVGNPVPCGTPVETFDCQCLIVHSSLVQKHHLRFDENLTFDLYAEDFCIAAREKAGIISRILPLSARHWSGGSVQPRYYTQEAYLNLKYPNACYTGTSSWIIGGRPPFWRRLIILIKRTFQKFRP